MGYICCLAINARLVWSNAGYLSVAGHACMSFAEAAWETLFVARSACMCFAEVTLDTFFAARYTCMGLAETMWDTFLWLVINAYVLLRQRGIPFCGSSEMHVFKAAWDTFL